MQKILVIDDSPTARHDVASVLARAGYLVLEAEATAGAIARLDSSIAMVICDGDLPGVPGLVEALRALAHGSAPPILLMTDEATPGWIERARQAGARGWMHTPCQPTLLIALVRRLAAAHEAAGTAGAPSADLTPL